MPVIYSDAPEEIEDMAAELIAIHQMADAADAEIKLLMKEADKSSWLGICSRPTGPWEHLTGVDYVICLWKNWWNMANENQRRALVFHELCHIKKTESDKWVLAKHPIEAFPQEIHNFGFWHGSLRALEPLTRKPREKMGERCR